MTKSIWKAVGIGGPNLQADICVVQYLLNCVPAAKGGPLKELAVDGHMDVVVIEAIRRFQRITGAKMSGRLDPRGIADLQGHDPFPHLELSNIGEFHPRLVSANQLSKVVVRGYDAVRKKNAVGAAHPRSPLGGPRKPKP